MSKKKKKVLNRDAWKKKKQQREGDKPGTEERNRWRKKSVKKEKNDLQRKKNKRGNEKL